MKRLICAVLIALALTGCSNNTALNGNNDTPKSEASSDVKIQSLTIEQKLEDFEYLYNVISTNYPYFEMNKRVYNVDWLANKEAYKEEIRGTSNDEDYFVVLSKIMSDLNDGHADMIAPQYFAFLKSFSRIDYDKAWYKILHQDIVSKRYGSVKYKGHKKNNDNPSTYFNNIKTAIINDGEVAYIAIESFKPEFYDEAEKKIPDFFKSILSSKALIIDIRKNTGGGDACFRNLIVPYLIKTPLSENRYTAYRGDSYIEPFLLCRNRPYKNMGPISELKDILPNLPDGIDTDFKYYNNSVLTIEPSDSVGYDGDIYLLVSNNVFSASDSFASFAKNTNFATLIGNTTGGQGGSGIDPAIAYLPNSGYVFRFPPEMVLNSDGSNNAEIGVEPDHMVDPYVYTDITKDKCVQKAMELSGIVPK